MGIIMADGEWSVPLLPAVMGVLRFRPSGLGYGWSREGLCWSRDRSDKGLRAKRYQTCELPSAGDKPDGVFRMAIQVMENVLPAVAPLRYVRAPARRRR
jgi:hypothetical protein